MMADIEFTQASPIQFTVPFDDDHDDVGVIIHSSDKAHFRLYKSILNKTSPVFRDMFQTPTGEPSVTLHTVDMVEDAVIRSNVFNRDGSHLSSGLPTYRSLLVC